MKTFKLFGVLAAAALILLTSCLGDSNNTRTLNSQFAVARFDSKSSKILLDVNGLGAVYSSEIQSYINDGNCYLIDLTVDFSSAENANAADNGYYVAIIPSIPSEVIKGLSIQQVADTTALLENEQPISELVINNYLSGYLLMSANFDQLKNQQNRWEIYYDPMQEGSEDKNGNRYYDLFIRTVKHKDGEGSSTTKELVRRAFEAKSFIEKCIEKEKADNKTVVNLKFNYVQSISKENEMKWAAFSAALPF